MIENKFDKIKLQSNEKWNYLAMAYSNSFFFSNANYSVYLIETQSKNKVKYH